MANESQNPNLEKIARAYREGIYGAPIADEAWNASRNHWTKDAEKFIALLAAKGLEIVEIKPKKPAGST